MKPVLLDEHVGRVFEHVLRDRGFEVRQAKDFGPLHQEVEHAGVLLYYEQSLPDDDPEGLARVVETFLEQYGSEELRNEIVRLDTWYDLLQE
jgi:hypothetical protein